MKISEPELTKLHGSNVVCCFFKMLVKQSYSVTCSLKVFFFFPFLAWQFSHLYSVQSVKNIRNCKHCMQCHRDLKQVFVLLRGGESHCIWQRLSLAQLSLQSGFQWRKKMWQHAACDKSSNQTYISSVPYVGILSYLVLLNIMIAPERVRVLQNVLFNTECLQASTTEYSSTEIIHVS